MHLPNQTLPNPENENTQQFTETIKSITVKFYS